MTVCIASATTGPVNQLSSREDLGCTDGLGHQDPCPLKVLKWDVHFVAGSALPHIGDLRLPPASG
jgi:hypothetical protein